MSDFVDMLVEMLPMHSALQKSDNQVRSVLDKTVGSWMDEFDSPFDELFLESATGGWLDAHGRDYGVPRRLDEDDDTYRQRIVYEKKDNLTVGLLYDVYGVELFNAYDGFNPSDNNLTSDNPYISDFLFGVVDTETQQILNKKFIMDNSVLWYNDTGLDYIFNTDDTGALKQYRSVYQLSEAIDFFKNNTDIENVKLTLPSVTDVTGMFYGCTGLTDIVLSLPLLEVYTDLFYGCSALEFIDVTIPEGLVSGFESYVLGLDLANLDTFIVNGEEVELE